MNSSVNEWLFSSKISPSLNSLGRRSSGNDAVSRQDGRVLRPLGGLRLGERGPTECLSRASECSGEGADGVSVGTCVLGEVLIELPVPGGKTNWTTVQGHTCVLSSIYCHNVTIPHMWPSGVIVVFSDCCSKA